LFYPIGVQNANLLDHAVGRLEGAAHEDVEKDDVNRLLFALIP
jgi:hypothetical protein